MRQRKNARNDCKKMIVGVFFVTLIFTCVNNASISKAAKFLFADVSRLVRLRGITVGALGLHGRRTERKKCRSDESARKCRSICAQRSIKVLNSRFAVTLLITNI